MVSLAPFSYGERFAWEVFIPPPLPFRNSYAPFKQKSQELTSLSAKAPGRLLRDRQPKYHDEQHEGSRVFSDLDDTLLCSKGAKKGLTGLDILCDEKGEIYPGAIQFMLELGRGSNQSASPPRVVPLSSRPSLSKVPKVEVRIQEDHPLNVAFESYAAREDDAGRARDWGLDLGRAQYGRLLKSLPAVFRRYEGMARSKVEGWMEFNSKVPSFFIGDNGQGDAEAAQIMRRVSLFEAVDGFVDDDDAELDEKHRKTWQTMRMKQRNAWETMRDDCLGHSSPFEVDFGKVISEECLAFLRYSYDLGFVLHSLRAAFIHHVQDSQIHGGTELELVPGSGKYTNQSQLAKGNIHLFYQYGHAACIAYQQKFISAQGYRNVMSAISSECKDNTERIVCRIILPEFKGGDFDKALDADACAHVLNVERFLATQEVRAELDDEDGGLRAKMKTVVKGVRSRSR
jgi:hypothetical protein